MLTHPAGCNSLRRSRRSSFLKPFPKGVYSGVMTEHPRIAQRRLASAGDRLGQWLQEAGTEWEAHGVVADEVWQRIEETALEVAALARELGGSEKGERD